MQEAVIGRTGQYLPAHIVTFRGMTAVRSLSMAGSIFAAIVLPAQETAAPKSPLRFGMNLLPAMAYRELVQTEKNTTTESIIAFRNGYEIPRFAYGANLVCALDLSDRFSVEAGIGYSLMGYQLDMDGLVFGDAIDPNRGFIYETNAAPTAIRYSIEYLEVPLRLVMGCGKGRWRSITGIGLTTGYLLRSGHVLRYPDGSTDRSDTTSEDDYRSINLFPTLSTGAAYKLNDHIELRLEASGRYGVMDIVDAPISAQLWSAGLGCGVMWTP